MSRVLPVVFLIGSVLAAPAHGTDIDCSKPSLVSDTKQELQNLGNARAYATSGTYCGILARQIELTLKAYEIENQCKVEIFHRLISRKTRSQLMSEYDANKPCYGDDAVGKQRTEETLQTKQRDLIERKSDPNKVTREKPKPAPVQAKPPAIKNTDHQRASHLRRTGLASFKKGDPERARDSFAQCAGVFLECATLRDAMNGVIIIDNTLKRTPALQIKMYRNGIAAIQKALARPIATEARASLQQALDNARRDLAEAEQSERERTNDYTGKQAVADKPHSAKKSRQAAWECIYEIERWQNKSSYRIKLENTCEHSVKFRVTTCDSKAFGGRCSTTSHYIGADSTDVLESFIQYPDYDLRG